MSLTTRQLEANALLAGPATHLLLYGGSRSGKTYLILRAIVLRALKAQRSSHAVLRFRFAHLRASIIEDTWPKVLDALGVTAKMDKQAWFAEFPNGSKVWFGGLDDKERVERILGQEHASVFLNECSQISYASREVARTRLAQQCMQACDGKTKALPLRMYYDCNPPTKAHWSYRLFFDKLDPETRRPLPSKALSSYAALQMNPRDNAEHLAPGYLEELETMAAHRRKRFLEGQYAEVNPNALWPEDVFDRWRVTTGELPDMQRVVIPIDPSGASDDEEQENDEIGIVPVGLGTDGNAYVLEDLSVQAGPATWGNIAAAAYDRHAADRIIGEANYGGAMVEHVVKTAKPNVPYEAVTATRGKVVRAEPIAALYEQGKVRHVGYMPDLEAELCGFSTSGYTGEDSPNRADAMIWGMSSLFPGIVRERKAHKPLQYDFHRAVV